MTPNQYFRAGVGMILYTEDRQIYLFNRTDIPTLWQFPQGGMDAGETVEETLWRELEEETGLTQEAVLASTPYPSWLFYEYDQTLRSTLRDSKCRGQIHRWFFLKLRPDTVIDLKTAEHQEFQKCRLATFSELLTQQDTLKQQVFSVLADYFRHVP